MLRILITETVFILLECITHIKIYKAPWAPPGFKVSLSLVEYGVKNFRKCFICRKSCSESMAYYYHGLHTGYMDVRHSGPVIQARVLQVHLFLRAF
jgi:hypothetical protein